MIDSFLLRHFLYQKVRFQTCGNVELTGEVRILGNGRVGILTTKESFSAGDVKRVRRMR
ncbi:hypothetical protein [Ferroplasma sp.]|uniref:hypothetical protein n=1 Tax=Ferroplasma sp. TaxID=2591003 RepID=UPI00261845CB|nr:hypothetical protein [Ferroplasma sp.]